MATIRFYTAVDMRFFSNTGTVFHDSIAGGTLTSSTADMFRIDEGFLGRDTFYGTGLGGASSNMPTTGTVTEWSYETNTGPGTFALAWDFYDFSVAANVFSPYVLNDDIDTLLSSQIMAGSDFVVGSDGNDVLLGYTGDDILSGNGGNDLLNGGAGGDSMGGGGGDDTYIVDSDGDTISESLNAGTDSIVLRYAPGSGHYVLSDNVENITNGSGAATWIIANSLDNVITGSSAGGDILYGRDGNDVIDGGAGGDGMYGGNGDDIFIVDNASDFVTDYEDTIRRGSGTDEVRASVTYSLNDPMQSDIENLRLTGTAAINATGNAISNVLTGNSGANVLDGRGGADTMRGGDGNDIYYVDNSGDVVVETSTGGVDSVRSRVSFALAANVENLQLLGSDAANATGNGIANILNGNSAENLMFGRDGNDTLLGNAGNDSLYAGNGDDSVFGGDGEDWIEGGAGRDLLTGGADADLFVFRDGDFGNSYATADRIMDFSRSDSDQIRLNAIDASTLASGNQAFAFIGTSAFHHVAGELRYQEVSGNTYVFGDTNGDGTADLFIRIDGSQTLVASDFVL